MLISPIGQDNSDISNTSATGQASADFTSYLEGQDNSLSAIFREASETYGVPVSLLTAMAKQESNFQANATSKSGAMGIMQLMPATASYFGVENPYDPRENIMAGAKYISQLLTKYNGDTSLALAAYNAGSGNVRKYGGIPPFKETQNYVAKILGYMEEGVTLPDGSQTASAGSASGTGAPGNIAAAEAVSPATLEDILDRFFSYDDYLRFLELFLQNLDTFADIGGSSRQEDTDFPSDRTSDSAPYQSIRYSQSVLRLLTKPSEES